MIAAPRMALEKFGPQLSQDPLAMYHSGLAAATHFSDGYNLILQTCWMGTHTYHIGVLGRPLLYLVGLMFS